MVNSLKGTGAHETWRRPSGHVARGARPARVE